MTTPFQARTVASSQLPVIDISGLSSPLLAERRAVGQRIREACLHNGFL